jgi:hypothetical protein
MIIIGLIARYRREELPSAVVVAGQVAPIPITEELLMEAFVMLKGYASLAKNEKASEYVDCMMVDGERVFEDGDCEGWSESSGDEYSLEDERRYMV